MLFARACVYILSFIGLNLGYSLKFPLLLSSDPSCGISIILVLSVLSSTGKDLRRVSGELFGEAFRFDQSPLLRGLRAFCEQEGALL